MSTTSIYAEPKELTVEDKTEETAEAESVSIEEEVIIVEEVVEERDEFSTTYQNNCFDMID